MILNDWDDCYNCPASTPDLPGILVNGRQVKKETIEPPAPAPAQELPPPPTDETVPARLAAVPAPVPTAASPFSLSALLPTDIATLVYINFLLNLFVVVVLLIILGRR